MNLNMTLKQNIEKKLHAAFSQVFTEMDWAVTPIDITPSTHERFGHYQCNSAMKLTKLLKMPPRQIAEKITAVIEQDRSFAHIEIAGPGFINMTLSADFLSQYCQQMTQKRPDSDKTDEQVVIDFSSPNVAKEMHVGHLRSTIIGDSLARLLEYLGYPVLRLNHIGDWGTAFGMLIAYIKQYEPGIITHQKEVDLTTLVQFYKAAKKQFDEDAEFKKQSQLEVVKLQQGENEALKAWQVICEISRKAYQEIYDLLDIHLIERGESYYNPQLAEIVADLESKGLIEISDGAKCLFLEGFNNREGEPLPFMLQKSDGGFNYATTDMAAIRHRIQDEKASRIIYVTDAGQATHFAMLFAAAQKAGYLDPSKVRVDHVPFGLVLGPDGKKFKTRSGETERLIDLLTAAVSKAEEILQARNQEAKESYSSDEIKQIAKVLGINAVKYSDLVCNRTHDYTFSYDRMLRFEGNTAAFLMYSFVRIQGIKRKIQGEVSKESIYLVHPSEINLGLHLAQFDEILLSIADDLLMNRLCEYLYQLAEKFNAFFRDCRVEGVPEQNQRLALCELTAHVLKTGLTILGLQTVTRM
ncbi:arginine--tRNA ligase [Candidatus Berkiella aquae]|uniref:Arginine--tRNA ligase n=1 Tax=Candidatus Berkiella aquae TaxID=295108 RepID=A0A0Q9YK98_9GAMM|nr:arginine--tRNA ligase [Candidatus Berkiella aquae]MCS5711201.1 arginine--tRNA ligase [Candidatus Berkiella aquae]